MTAECIELVAAKLVKVLQQEDVYVTDLDEIFEAVRDDLKLSPSIRGGDKKESLISIQ